MSDIPENNNTVEPQEEHLEPEMEQELEEMEQEAKAQTDRILRLQADIENMKRRSERDISNAHKYASEKFIKDLLAVVDSLEMAQQGEHPEQAKGLLEGVELTHKLFLDTLIKHGVEQIDPEGQPFDPEFQEAVSMQPNPEVDANTVLQVVQKGYKLHGRLLKPAMVIVSS